MEQADGVNVLWRYELARLVNQSQAVTIAVESGAKRCFGAGVHPAGQLFQLFWSGLGLSAGKKRIAFRVNRREHQPQSLQGLLINVRRSTSNEIDGEIKGTVSQSRRGIALHHFGILVPQVKLVVFLNE